MVNNNNNPHVGTEASSSESDPAPSEPKGSRVMGGAMTEFKGKELRAAGVYLLIFNISKIENT